MDDEDYQEALATVESLLGLLAGIGFLYFVLPFFC